MGKPIVLCSCGSRLSHSNVFKGLGLCSKCQTAKNSLEWAEYLRKNPPAPKPRICACGKSFRKIREPDQLPELCHSCWIRTPECIAERQKLRDAKKSRRSAQKALYAVAKNRDTSEGEPPSGTPDIDLFEYLQNSC